MDQKLEGTPSVEIKLEGRTVVRSEIQNNWGTRLQWRLFKEGKEIATGPVGPETAFDLPDLQQGSYQVVVQQFHYLNYKRRRTESSRTASTSTSASRWILRFNHPPKGDAMLHVGSTNIPLCSGVDRRSFCRQVRRRWPA